MVSSLSIDKDSIEIGESINLFYKLTFPRNAKIKHIDFAVFDSLESLASNLTDTSSVPYYAEIEWIAPFADKKFRKVKPSTDQLINTQNKTEYRDTFQATFWDLGFYQISHPIVALDTTGVQANMMKLESPIISVYPPANVTNTDTTTAILPIKTIIEEDKTIEDFMWIFYSLAALVVLGVLFYFISRPKREETIIKEKVITPSHTQALTKLEKLRHDKLWESGQVKEHQSQLTYIIREYLEKRFKVNALESTTEQIVKSLNQQDIKLDQENELREILQIADMVKFAKANPPIDINEAFIIKAENFVQDTKDNNEVERIEVTEEVVKIRKPSKKRPK